MLAPKAETKTEGGPPQEVGAEGDKPDGNHRQPRDAAHQPPEHAGAVTDNRDAGPLEPAEQVGGRPPEELDAGPLGEQAPEPRQEDGDGQAQSGAGGGARGETCGPGHQVGDRDDSEHRHDPPPVSLAGSGHGHSSMLAASRASRVSMSPLAT